MKPKHTPRTVTCPACGKPAAFSPDNEWRPFCSERCRLVDLGAWATESYRIAQQRPDEAGEGDPDDAESR